MYACYKELNSLNKRGYRAKVRCLYEAQVREFNHREMEWLLYHCQDYNKEESN